MSFGFFFAGGTARATHIVGGQIELLAVGDKPGHFTLAVTYYFDEDQTFVPLADAPVPIFSKRDNAFVRAAIVFNQTVQRPLLRFINAPCSSRQQLRISVVRYTGELLLNPADFADPQGYYITYQTCCRNGGITSIQNPAQAGYVFYAEFPPLIRRGKPFFDSLPVFDPIDSEYICVGEPFVFDFDAHDADGDELRYSLVAPLQGLPGTNGVAPSAPGPYPAVNWANGFGADRAIPGSPPLSIDARTGQLSVTASQQGLFVFAVLVEEYRGGERIGAVRRDYQFLVVDCPPAIPPNPVITVDAVTRSSVTLCQGQSVLIEATVNAGWAYQWRRNGLSLPGATIPSLAVDSAGRYQLITTLKAACSRTRRSVEVVVSVVSPRLRLTPDSLPPVCPMGPPVTLRIYDGTGNGYTWYRDGDVVPGEASATLTTRVVGRYWTVGQSSQPGCPARSDTVVVRAGTLPVARLSLPGSQTAVCAGDSVVLLTTPAPGYTYQWLLADQPVPGATGPRYAAVDSGRYVVRVRDSTGCETLSDAQVIRVLPKLTARLDSLPPICDPATARPLLLRGSPAGGVFAGPGVQQDRFDPQRAGAGEHPLTYTVSGALTCQMAIARRVAVVHARPVVALGLPLAVWPGQSVVLPGPLNPDYTLRWEPPQSLDDASRGNPRATPQETTRYQLTVRDRYGCVSGDTLLVRVFTRLGIPDAFSPNGDGLNETWVLRGIETYADAEVTIFTRWGEVIFYSRGYARPFDGTFKNQPLGSGQYPFVVQAASANLRMSGTVTILY